MKKQVVIITATALSLALLLSLVACNVSIATKDERITYQGKVLTAVLAENPTTGYEWSISIDSSTLETSKDDYVSDANPRGASGAGGTRTLEFTGVSGGTATITLVYERSWEPDPNNQTIVVTVTTADDGAISDVLVQ